MSVSWETLSGISALGLTAGVKYCTEDLTEEKVGRKSGCAFSSAESDVASSTELDDADPLSLPASVYSYFGMYRFLFGVNTYMKYMHIYKLP